MRGTKRIGSGRRPKRSGTKKSTRGARGRVAPPKKTARRGRKGAKRPRSTRRRRRRHQRGGVSASQAQADSHFAGSFTSDLSNAAEDVAEVLDFKKYTTPAPHNPATDMSSQPKSIPRK
jgi:hypothetical protein